MITKAIKRNILMFLLSLMIGSCGIRTFYLKDSNVLKAPLNPKKYVDINEFNESLYTLIDTETIYKEDNIKALNDEYYWVLKFYPNGRFNLFIVNDNHTKLYTEKTFNPEYHGYRGYYNLVEGVIKFDAFLITKELRGMGKVSGTIKVEGDVLKINAPKHNLYITTIKSDIDKKLIDFMPSW